MKYIGPKKYRPISAWGYIGYMVLYTIPIIGTIFLIIFAFSDKNINRRNFARSYFYMIILLIVVLIYFYLNGDIEYYYQFYF